MQQAKCIVNQLKEGDYLSRTSYMRVKGVAGGAIFVENEQGLNWSIGRDIVEKECYSHNQVLETKEVTRTELIGIFSQTGDAVYTVNYCKQPKVEDAYDAVANDGRLKTNAAIKKALKEKMKGEERTLIGYTIKPEPLWGRSMVVDLEQPDKQDNIRQVDHRTLNWLILKNVKYVVK